MAKVKTPRRTRKAKSGAEIDPKTADALASEAERGYDLAKGRRRRVGRPSLGSSGASPRVGFRTTPELYRAAKRRASDEGRTVSDVAREALARYVKS